MQDSCPPLVSIIIPCYNTARFVEETMRSALAQTYKNIEVIIVNDGSTDKSEQVIKSVQDQRVYYIYQENQGLSAARNTGIRNAKGDFLTFLDADDLFSPEKIETQINYFKKSPETDIVACGFSRTNEQGDILYPVKLKEKQVSMREMLSGSQFPVHTALVRRKTIEETGFFDTSLRAAEDWDYWCRCALNKANIYRLAQPLCTYRLLDDAMTANAPRQTEMLRQVVEKNFANPALPDALKTLKSDALATVFLTGAARCLVLSFHAEGKDYLEKAIELNPKIKSHNFTLLCGKIAGMMVHMNVKNVEKKSEKIYEELREKFGMGEDFKANLIFRTQLTKGKNPLLLLVTKPRSLKFAVQLLLQKINK